MLSELISFFLCQQESLQSKPFPCVFSKNIPTFFNCACFIHTQVNRSPFIEFYSSLVEYKVSSSPCQGWRDWGSGEVCGKPQKVTLACPECSSRRISLLMKKTNIFHYIYIIETCVHHKCFQRMQNDMWGNDPNSPPHPSYFQAWFPPRALPLWHLFSMFSVRCVHHCLFLVLVFYLHKENLTLHVALVPIFST